VSVLAQFALFLSSYAPLFGVFALLDTFGKGVPSGVCIVLALLGLALPGALFAAVRKLEPQPLQVATAQIRDGDALAYIATYIVPFAAMAATTARERWAISLFVLLIAVLYVRSGLFYVNPLLALVGYRLFQVATPGGASVVLITRRSFVHSGTPIAARRLGQYVYWEAKS
jgi:hypothetical protein